MKVILIIVSPNSKSMPLLCNFKRKKLYFSVANRLFHHTLFSLQPDFNFSFVMRDLNKAESAFFSQRKKASQTFRRPTFSF
jgi:hypothetical protein